MVSNSGGPKFIQYYGQTEAPLILTLLDKQEHVVTGSEEEARLLSCGRPVSTTSLKIVDDTGAEVPDGTIGEICVKSSQAMVGYWKAPELTGESIKGGWIPMSAVGKVVRRLLRDPYWEGRERQI